jgi:predicted Zn-dependent protease
MVTGQTFLDWYERWLDGELDRLAKHEASLQARLAEESNSLPSGLELAGHYLRQARLPELDRLLERLDGQANAAASPEARIKVLALRARVHLARQEYPAAKELLRTGLAQFPDSVYLWQVQSHALLQEDKDPHAAQQALRKLMELQPDDAGASRALETLLSRQGASPNV